MEVTHFEELSDQELTLDVRTPDEVTKGTVPHAVSIPVDELRSRLNELPKDRPIHAYCAAGIRSYIACRILSQNGFMARNLVGGYATYLANISEKLLEAETAQQLKNEFCTGL